MANIREVLTLEDKFSAAFTQYIKLGTDAAASTKEVRDAATRAAAASRVQSAAMNAAASSAKAQTAAYRTSVEQARAQAAASKAATEAVRLETAELKKLKAEQDLTAKSTNTLVSSIKNMVGAYVGMQTITGLVNLSDTMTQTTARLNMMNDGQQDVVALNNMIYQSAQRSRGAYQETADMVAKLGTLAGDAFNSSAEIVAFAEQINKQMTLSGASTMGAQAAMLQLTQAMSSGVLRGEELNSILEQTPTIAQAIADYMGVSTGQMREMASEGVITAQVVKNALFDAAEKTDEKFRNMPMTWGQVWISFKNTAIMALQPVLSGINLLAEYVDVIAPLVLGAAGAFVVFQIAANWTKIAAAATAAYHFVVNLLSIGFGVLTGNTAAASAAVFTFNSALLASPITWIVMGLMLVVAALYAGVAAYNHFTQSSISATGIVAGAFFTLGAMIWNQFLVPTQNGFAAFANFVGNVFNDPVTAVKVLFYDMALTVLGYIRSVANGIQDLINAIPGVEVNLTSGIESLYGALQSNRQAAIDAGSYKEYVKAWEYKDLSEAAAKGYNWGSNLNLLGGLGDMFDLSGYTSNVPAYNDLAGIAGDVSDIAGSANSIQKAVNMSEEDLKSLVDVAERRYVNNINLTAQSPVINVTGQNTGNTQADRMNLANTIRDILVEQVAAGSTVNTSTSLF